MSDNTEFYFQWHITNSCNNRCKHCYHSDYSNEGQLSIEDLQKIANEIEDTLKKWDFLASISITGGEPFTRKNDLYKILNYIDTKCEHILDYDILTNGTLITDNECNELRNLKKLRRVQVSLEGASAEKHDCVRGEGDFYKVTEAIKLLKSNNISVSVMTTLTKNNINYIDKIIELLASLNVDYFALERFMPEGQGDLNKDWVLNKEETQKTFKHITERALKIKKPTILLYRTLFCLCNNDQTVGAMCSAGVNALTILPDASILACRRLPIVIGNVLKDGIIKTWYNSKVLWDLRNYSEYKGKCQSCEYFTNCRGCRSMAFLLTGDYMQEDPQCWK